MKILPLPLTGPAYAVANEAYAAYNRKDYDLAIAKAARSAGPTESAASRAIWAR